MVLININSFIDVHELFIPALEPGFLDVCSSGIKYGGVFSMDLLQHLGSLLTMSKPRKAYIKAHDEKLCKNAELSSFLLL